MGGGGNEEEDSGALQFGAAKRKAFNAFNGCGGGLREELLGEHGVSLPDLQKLLGETPQGRAASPEPTSGAPSSSPAATVLDTQEEGEDSPGQPTPKKKKYYIEIEIAKAEREFKVMSKNLQNALQTLDGDM
eukprot:1206104-Alexandrium_andersonii.AAC.1